MSENEFKYVDPLDKGYLKVKLTTKQHNKLFPARHRKWQAKYDYYISENNFIMETTISKRGLLFCIAMFLPNLLWTGLENFKGLCSDYGKLINQKEKGNHVRDVYSSGNEMYDYICEEINFKKPLDK